MTGYSSRTRTSGPHNTHTQTHIHTDIHIFVESTGDSTQVFNMYFMAWEPARCTINESILSTIAITSPTIRDHFVLFTVFIKKTQSDVQIVVFLMTFACVEVPAMRLLGSLITISFQLFSLDFLPLALAYLLFSFGRFT